MRRLMRMRIDFVYFIFALSLLASHSQAEPTKITNVETLCKERACRTGGYDVVVHIGKDRYTSIAVTHSPYVMEDGGILLFPGEAILIQFAIEENKVSHPNFVKRLASEFISQIPHDHGQFIDNPENSNLTSFVNTKTGEIAQPFPPNSVFLSYGQMKDSDTMILHTRSNFEHDIRYDAYIELVKPDKYEEHISSTCPIRAKLTTWESWAPPLGPIILDNFRYIINGDDGACRVSKQ